MNRYPLWKNLMIGIVLILGLLYTLPNFYGEVPAVQISATRSTVKVDNALEDKVLQALTAANIQPTGTVRDPGSLRVRLANVDTQMKARDVIERALNPDPQAAPYVVALNLLSASPQWLTSIGALPMYLGLDLRGGVHFLLQIDMQGAVTKQLDVATGDLRTLLRDKNIRHSGISREGDRLTIRLRDDETRSKARDTIRANRNDLEYTERTEGEDRLLIATLTQQARRTIQEDAIKQNIVTLHNRCERTRRGRTGNPAAGGGPHRGAAARRAGREQGQGHDRPYRHLAGAHGGRRRQPADPAGRHRCLSGNT